MFEFCPHCGGSIDQEQVAGALVVCRHCGQSIGVVVAPKPTAVIDRAQELIQAGSAALCPACGQLVALKARSFVPHRGAGNPRVCPNSGKPISDAARGTTGGTDVSAFQTKDVIRVILVPRGGLPSIEELTFEYVDKADRVRIQIEAIRAILGPAFRMAEFPPALGRSAFAMWASAAACVIGKRHQHGGLEPMADADVATVLGDLDRHRALFFA